MIETSAGPVPLLPPAPPAPPQPAALDVVIVLRPLPDSVPADRRLAQLLKVALRRFRLKCVKCVDVPPGGAAAE